MKKNIVQKAGWIFVGSFAGLHLLQGLAEMARRQMVLSGSAEGNGIVYRILEQISTFLRYFLAGPSLVASPSETLVPREIGGACLIGLFVVAASVWLLSRYGWKRTCLYWGTALALSLLLCDIMGNVVASRFSSLVIFSGESIEVARRSAGYVLLYQIPAWLLYTGLRKIFRDAGEREKTE